MLRLALATCLIPFCANAAPQKSCPPLGTLPNYVASESVLRTYDKMPFSKKVANSDDGEPIEVAGRTCTTAYQIADGKDPMSNLEIQMNYRQQLEQMGATIESAGGRNLDAHLVRGGVETWLHVYSEESTIELRVLQVVAPKMTLLPPSGNDYRLLGHMPDFAADKPVTRNFDKMEFEVAADDGTKSIEAQGKTFYAAYALKDGKTEPSNPEIQFNYLEALKAQGAEILYIGGRDITARLLNNGQLIWMRVYASGSSIEVFTVEEKPFEASIKPPPPAEVQSALDKTGRVALYVNFDFDKAVLRPEAAAVVAEVVAMLKANPTLRLGIEGHTDALGVADHNRTLSADRAKSFVAAIVAQGIAADRLQPAGFGPDKPIATNDTSDGRAKNRRVELVKL